ncbi:MAG: type II secretion system protein GspE, partial [Candidatus Terrybacteria bacterium]|nr:type II secretion system protein GspE [Candidatus Terrybacteria bacterium]
IPRLIDLGGAPFLLASTLNVIIAQRLVRKVCEHCVTSRAPTAAEDQALREQLRLLDIPRKLATPKFLYRGSGCASCGGTGYQGRTGIFEILPVSEAIRALILESASVTKIRATAFQEGMITMFEDGVEKAERGVTTLEEVLRVVRE